MSSDGLRRRGLVAIAMLAAGPVHAQDALRGKRLYLDAARIVGSGVSCVDCHGGLPGGLFGIGRAAGDPAAVENAISSVPQMAPFRGRLAELDMVDLAAYLGDPAVPSPQLQLTTRRPDGDAGPADRIEFGDVGIGAASAAATLQITNTGRVAFALTSDPEVAGRNAGEFSIESSDCRAGVIVPAMGSCRVALRFRPVGAEGARVARVSVAHDWVYGVAAVALLATAAPRAAPPPEPPGCRSSQGDAGWPVLGLLVLLPWLRRAGGGERVARGSRPRRAG